VAKHPFHDKVKLFLGSSRIRGSVIADRRIEARKKSTKVEKSSKKLEKVDNSQKKPKKLGQKSKKLEKVEKARKKSIGKIASPLGFGLMLSIHPQENFTLMVRQIVYS
jgi:hypothetical protein